MEAEEEPGCGSALPLSLLQEPSSSPTSSSSLPAASRCSSWRWRWANTPAKGVSQPGGRSAPSSRVCILPHLPLHGAAILPASPHGLSLPTHPLLHPSARSHILRQVQNQASWVGWREPGGETLAPEQAGTLSTDAGGGGGGQFGADAPWGNHGTPAGAEARGWSRVKLGLPMALLTGSGCSGGAVPPPEHSFPLFCPRPQQSCKCPAQLGAMPRSKHAHGQHMQGWPLWNTQTAYAGAMVRVSKRSTGMREERGRGSFLLFQVKEAAGPGISAGSVRTGAVLVGGPGCPPRPLPA